MLRWLTGLNILFMYQVVQELLASWWHLGAGAASIWHHLYWVAVIDWWDALQNLQLWVCIQHFPHPCMHSGSWLASNWEAYLATGQMHEKYDAYRPGMRGAGGEYTPQVSVPITT
jgi:hypothetical protein